MFDVVVEHQLQRVSDSHWAKFHMCSAERELLRWQHHHNIDQVASGLYPALQRVSQIKVTEVPTIVVIIVEIWTLPGSNPGHPI